MSSDLIELCPNVYGDDISLRMVASGDAYLQVIDAMENCCKPYRLAPTKEGIEQAETIIKGLQEWIRHIKECDLVKE